MFKRQLTYIFLYLASVFLSGCFPVQYTLNPGASGIVVDAQNKKPIAGASVLLTTSSNVDPTRRVSATTNEQGEFVIPADQKWGVYIVPMDPIGLEGVVTVQAMGYNGTKKKFRTSSMGPANSKLGIIPLERSQ